MVPGPPSPEPRSPPPPDRKRRSTAGAAGNRGSAGTPRPLVPPGISLLPSRTAPVPAVAALRCRRSSSVRDLRPPPLPSREGPAAAGPATPSDAADPVPRRCCSPHQHGSHQHGPPTKVLPDHGRCRPGRRSREPRPLCRGPARPPWEPEAPSECGHGFSACCTALGQYRSLHRQHSSGPVHLMLFIFIQIKHQRLEQLCLPSDNWQHWLCYLGDPQTPTGPAKTWHSAGVCAVF